MGVLMALQLQLVQKEKGREEVPQFSDCRGLGGSIGRSKLVGFLGRRQACTRMMVSIGHRNIQPPPKL